LLAYTTDTTGFRQYELHVKDLKTGKLLGDTMPRVTSLAWAADNATLMLAQEDATTKRADRLFRLPLGGTLQQVYHEPVEQFAIGVSRTRDHRYFVLTARSTDTSEVLLLPTSQPQGNFQSVLKREKGHRYGIEHRDGQLYILTNKDAKNFRVVSAPLSAPQPKHWKPVVPHNKDAVIQSIDVFQGYLVVMEKARALNRARILDFAHKNWKTVQFDDPVYLATSAGTPEFSATQFRMSYQSPVTPPTVIDVAMADGKRTVLKQQEIVGGFDGSRYTTQRLWVTARDGVQVPLWIVYKKGVKLDGSAPLLLYSYGSYGISTEANFGLARISLLERGVIYAQAHIRGGTDMGEAWHEDGMLMKKKNTFNDF
ncbi:MAG: prolyl oligopeptidase family serine peptidase, partial [Janthinobacterium sp.]